MLRASSKLAYHHTYPAQEAEVRFTNKPTFLLVSPCCTWVPTVSTFVGLVGWKSFGKILTPDRNNDVFNLADGAIYACLSRKIADAFLGVDQGITHPEVVLRPCDK